MSPFVSKKQESACYASKGFGGKLDCKKYGEHKPAANKKSKPVAKKKSK